MGPVKDIQCPVLTEARLEVLWCVGRTGSGNDAARSNIQDWERVS